jgi:hypothetical protein
MKFELQITSPGTSNYMHLIGVRLKSDWMYNYRPITKQYIILKANNTLPGSKNLLHAYTIAELGVMIPWGYFQASPVYKMPGGIWQMKKKDGTVKSYATEVEARAWYLIDLLETENVTLNEVNYPEKYNQPAKKLVIGEGKPR